MAKQGTKCQPGIQNSKHSLENSLMLKNDLGDNRLQIMLNHITQSCDE